MMKKNIIIFDYGVGNHASVQQMLKSLGHRCRVSKVHEELNSADVIVLPGVGAFPAAMANLNEDDSANLLRNLAGKGKFIIGLCLGMQLLADKSMEYGDTQGLGLIPGVVRPLKHINWHIGWNSLEINRQESSLKLNAGDVVYFNHSYYLDTSDKYCLAKVSVNGKSFTAGVRRGNVCGLQFHPEKSQIAGKNVFTQLLEGVGNA
jgi:imidazole glycerol phosphate synthase glutamine amidotransferase subunit